MNVKPVVISICIVVAIVIGVYLVGSNTFQTALEPDDRPEYDIYKPKPVDDSNDSVIDTEVSPRSESESLTADVPDSSVSDEESATSLTPKPKNETVTVKSQSEPNQSPEFKFPVEYYQLLSQSIALTKQFPDLKDYANDNEHTDAVLEHTRAVLELEERISKYEKQYIATLSPDQIAKGIEQAMEILSDLDIDLDPELIESHLKEFIK